MRHLEVFNTHSFIKSLVNVGMDEKQAEIIANQQLAILEANSAMSADTLTTKEQIESSLSNIKKDIDQINWILLAVSLVILIALIKFLVT